MEFGPNNPVVKRCIQGMALSESGSQEDARQLFREAWDDATDDLEKFIAAHFVAHHHDVSADKLTWFEKALHYALAINDDSVRSALPELYSAIALCHDQSGRRDEAARNRKRASQSSIDPVATGPFYHGTKADLRLGDLLTPGGSSNYQPDLKMNHIYFTALAGGAGLAAALAKGDGPERVYVVDPTGEFENDPNVTNKKFPGNPTRSYRSVAPLRVVGEVSDWPGQTPAQLAAWREKLANNKGDIIN